MRHPPCVSGKHHNCSLASKVIKLHCVWCRCERLRLCVCVCVYSCTYSAGTGAQWEETQFWAFTFVSVDKSSFGDKQSSPEIFTSGFLGGVLQVQSGRAHLNSSNGSRSSGERWLVEVSDLKPFRRSDTNVESTTFWGFPLWVNYLLCLGTLWPKNYLSSIRRLHLHVWLFQSTTVHFMHDICSFIRRRLSSNAEINERWRVRQILTNAQTRGEPKELNTLGIRRGIYWHSASGEQSKMRLTRQKANTV